jgi:hypothetical protein
MLNMLYLLTFIVPAPCWFLMIFLPRTSLTRRLTNNYVVFIVLGLFYLVILIYAALALYSSAARNGQVVDFASLDGLTRALANPASVLIVWLHMITMDLIGGHWLYHEAERLNAPILVSSGCILLTYLFGPFGLMVFILWRNIIRRQPQPA